METHMFIAHLPAGYLLGKTLAGRKQVPRWALAVGMFGAIFPDLDLAYFYLIDHRQHDHHSYWIHKPLYWMAIAFVLVSLAIVFRSQRLRTFNLFFLTNVFGHLILDTYVGHIRWLSPISEQTFALFDVPAVHGWWVWNFVLHPTFGLEIAIACLALALFLFSNRSALRRSRELERLRTRSSARVRSPKSLAVPPAQ